jgi:tryptophan-rich sensory protein
MKFSLGEKRWWNPTNLAILGICLLVSHAAGGIGLIFSSSPGNWYASLTQPPGTPPGYVFGIVWPILYTLIGVALFLFIRSASEDVFLTGLSAFGIQWVLNTLWTPLFFGWNQSGLALIDLIALLLAIIWTWSIFRHESRWAGLLLIPYFFWCIYATYLNVGFYLLN